MNTPETTKLRSVEESAERVASRMDGRTVTSHEHYRTLLAKELQYELQQDRQQVLNAVQKMIDGEIEVLEQVLAKSKEYVGVGHKKVYEAIKIVSEYKGKLEAHKEIKTAIKNLLDVNK